MRLYVEAPGQVEAEAVSLKEDECVVLGRLPDGEHLPTDLEASLPKPRLTRPIGSPSVSANHAAAWLADGHVHLVDLGSRNGTWVRLPRATVVRLPAHSDIEVRLASAQWATGSEQQPEGARYTDAEDFGDGVALAVRAWLQRQDVPARVWASAKVTPPAPLPGVSPLRLASGESLFIQPERTVDGGFHERMVQICRYVNVQNALFTAEEETRNDGMVLASAGMRQVHRRVVELAMQRLPSVVLQGASGTGKERLAQAYHRSLGRSGSLVAINCATLSKDRFVADLFGAEAGAYTDAKRALIGAVESADGGTLFLDELGELPLDVQPLLLRFLETGEYQRLGAIGRPRFADVHIVAATNRDLRQMARAGAFREDLFFRLALEIIEIPPLKDRFVDAELYLRSQILGEVSVFDALTEDGLAVLRAYSWTGNFREIINFVRRLPRSLAAATLGADAVRRALQAGSLSSISPPSTPKPSTAASISSLREWLSESARAFADELGRETPTSWSDVSAFVEHYLKPWALAHLGDVADAQSIDRVSVGEVADRVKADRGTVIKQLRRYFSIRGDGVKEGGS